MIYISIGHYKEKPGACFNGFCEFDEAREWASQIVSLMGSENALLVPEGTLKQKVDFINQRTPLAAIEIHFNSMVSGTNAHGCETLYYPGSSKGKKLASELQASMIASGFKGRGVKEGYYRMDKSNGVDFFLDKTKCPSVIVEPEFIFNKSTILKNRDRSCTNISNSLMEALQWLKTTT